MTKCDLCRCEYLYIDEYQSSRGRATISDGYYHQYGVNEYNNNNTDNILIFSMGIITTIGICCFVMLISISINVIGQIYAKYSRRNHQDSNKYKYNDDDITNITTI